MYVVPIRTRCREKLYLVQEISRNPKGNLDPAKKKTPTKAEFRYPPIHENNFVQEQLNLRALK